MLLIVVNFKNERLTEWRFRVEVLRLLGKKTFKPPTV